MAKKISAVSADTKMITVLKIAARLGGSFNAGDIMRAATDEERETCREPAKPMNTRTYHYFGGFSLFDFWDRVHRVFCRLVHNKMIVPVAPRDNREKYVYVLQEYGLNYLNYPTEVVQSH